MKVVIPLSQYSQNNFLELRFVLRGIDLYVPNPEVTIVSSVQPDWIKNVQFIKKIDRPETVWRERNIADKIILAGEFITGDFLYMNDDHFLLAPWRDNFYYAGTLEQRIYQCPRGSIYRNTVANTLRICHLGKNFDCHCPITMNSTKLGPLKKLDWSLAYGYCVKSVYCYMNKIQGMPCIDLKIKYEQDYKAAIQGRTWFSTDDQVIDRNMLSLFKELYPTPSKFEEVKKVKK